MNENEAARRRVVTVLNADYKGPSTYTGEQVYSITATGVVIANGRERTLYPWHRVLAFTYDSSDTEARNKVRGW
jgi:hypothetical protein